MVTRILVVFLFGFAAFLIGTEDLRGQQYKPRTWTDSKGRTMEATYVEIQGKKVGLKRKNGKIAWVPFSNLSAADQEYLLNPKKAETSSRDPSYQNRLLAEERKLIFAAKIAENYQQLLDSAETPSEEKSFIRTRLDSISEHASQGSVLIKGKFRTQDEYTKMRKDADELVDQWEERISDMETIAAKNSKKLLDQAKRIDPVSLRADFVLGLYYFFNARNAEQATKAFKSCVRRAEEYLPLLDDIQKCNYAYALNNLALLKIRESKLQEARLHWRQMLTIDPNTTCETAHNIQRVVKVMEISSRDIDKSYLRPSSKTSKEYQDWKQELVEARLIMENIDSTTGWLYLPFIVDGKAGASSPYVKQGRVQPNSLFKGLEDTACLNCDGISHVKCPNSKCKFGKVTRYKDKKIPVQDGVYRIVKVPYKVTCPTCSGKERIDCWGCEEGKQDF